MSGFFGVKKSEINRLMPTGLKPKEVFVKTTDDPLQVLRGSGIGFPCVLKPDKGERGKEVVIVQSEEDVVGYHRKGFDFLVQEFIPAEAEYGVFFHKAKGALKVSSICKKEFASVVGDGQSTVEALIQNHPRHWIYLELFRAEHPNQLKIIPDFGENFIVHKIGNHAKGTRFVDVTWLAKSGILESKLEELLKEVDGFNYGRLDVKADDDDALIRGEIKVMEFNGVIAEPAHIYGMPHVLHAYKELYRHWNYGLKVSLDQMKKGAKTTPLNKFFVQARHHFFT